MKQITEVMRNKRFQFDRLRSMNGRPTRLENFEVSTKEVYVTSVAQNVEKFRKIANFLIFAKSRLASLRRFGAHLPMNFPDTNCYS